MPEFTYLRSGEAIYARSFEIIRAEADLSRFTEAEADIAVRMIHACGLIELAAAIEFGRHVVVAARDALAAGKPILCDSEMLAQGIIRRKLPAGNPVVCTLNEPAAAELAQSRGMTRSAAALDLWGERMENAVVAIGNAPTALFHLLELLDAGAPKPAAILGVPVGFVGAVESKTALAENPRGVPFLTAHGRIGGSAIAAAAVNGLAGSSVP